MNTKLLMSVSAVVLASAGIVLSFLPREVATMVGLPEQAGFIFQLLGALYFGFGMLNWMAKANLIGGIYSRPVATANLSHFSIGGLALAKNAFTSSAPVYLVVAAILYVVFALLFGYVFFSTPASVARSA